MTMPKYRTLLGYFIFSLSISFRAACLAILLTATAAVADDEPVAFLGHGGLFDQKGNQIAPTLDFVARAQDWYQATLLRGLDGDAKKRFAEFAARLSKAVPAEGQAGLIVQHQLLDWLLLNVPHTADTARIAGKLGALRSALNWTLRAGGESPPPEQRTPFLLDPKISDALASPDLRLGGVHVLSATINTGQAYLNECAAAGIATPPPLGRVDPAGLTGWRIVGKIPAGQQFIIQTPAEVRTYETNDEMCIALPRGNNATDPPTVIGADGVICLGKATSKVCFWDTQSLSPTSPRVLPNTIFTLGPNEQIPIGVPDLSVDSQGRAAIGGYDLNTSANGVCTDCHAGENPFIIHPNLSLGGGVLMSSVSRFAPFRYDPLVPSGWPQNEVSQAVSTLPMLCQACHGKTGTGKRLPLLSSEYVAYCACILPSAIGARNGCPVPPSAPTVPATMPPGAPGTLGGPMGEATLFMNKYCGGPRDLSAADWGDPHIVTVDGVAYDFQAAGEFTALRSEDPDFEVQTRQSPILTTFTPGANDYTGLASCLSLNTAVAMRIGKHRIAYDAPGGDVGSARGFRLRVDGAAVRSTSVISLGAGNTVQQSTTGGEVIVHIADGTVVTVTPVHWTDQHYWYLDVKAFSTTAREGVMGPINPPDWLPRAPNGWSFGPRPASLADRHVELNEKFADAWRVSNATSLFDYPPGLSTADYTDRDWPPPPGKSCASTTIGGFHPLVKRPQPELADKACRCIRDKTIRANCEFDITVMGNLATAAAYERADRLADPSRKDKPPEACR